MQDVTIAPNGDLVLTLPPRQGFPQRTLTETAPLAWQDIQGTRHFIPVQFIITQNKRVAFTVGSYNAAFPLIIDPSLTITYAWTNPTESEKIVPYYDGTWFLARVIPGQSILTQLDADLKPVGDIWVYPLTEGSFTDKNYLVTTPHNTLIWGVYSGYSRSIRIMTKTATGISTSQLLAPGQEPIFNALVAHPFLDQATLAWHTENQVTGDTTSNNLTTITANGIDATQQLTVDNKRVEDLAYARDGTLYSIRPLAKVTI